MTLVHYVEGDSAGLLIPLTILLSAFYMLGAVLVIRGKGVGEADKRTPKTLSSQSSLLLREIDHKK